MSPINRAAVLPRAKAPSMVIQALEYPTAGPGELVIKVAAIGINPIDWYVPVWGDDYFTFISYPYVGGFDVAGTVVQVGPPASGGGGSSFSFSRGVRVLALCAGLNVREGAFQEYVVVKANLSAPIPDALPFTDAAVLPCGLGTAAGALYEPGGLELALPDPETPAAPGSQGKTVLIWAGSSCVGSNAIQLAVASGYEVVTTCSPRNFDYCKSLGATAVLDYSSPTVEADIVAMLEGKDFAGAVAIQQTSIEPIYAILSRSEVRGSKRVGSVQPLTEAPPAPEGVTAKFVWAGTITENNVAGAIYHKFLPSALEAGSYQAKPSALVVRQGLESIQVALDKGRESKISARKLVVSLD